MDFVTKIFHFFRVDCAQDAGVAAAWLLRARLALKEGDPADAREFYERAQGLDANLRDEDLLERIVRAGGTKASGDEKKRLVMTGDGRYAEEYEE